MSHPGPSLYPPVADCQETGIRSVKCSYQIWDCDNDDEIAYFTMR